MGVSVFSSVAWAPLDVATELYTYYLVPEDRRPAFASLQNVTSNVAATVGSAVGSWIGAHLGIYYAFLASTILRLATAMPAYRVAPELRREGIYGLSER